MMCSFPKLSSIKILRKKHDLTQKKLATMCGISQSLITKLESKKLKPSYDCVVNIFKVLENFEKDSDKFAKDIMTKKVFSILENETTDVALKIMDLNNFSQLPVLNKKGNCTGFITEKLIRKKVFEKNLKPSEILIKNLMDLNIPTINLKTPKKMIREILKHEPAILVFEKNKIIGIITSQNFL